MLVVTSTALLAPTSASAEIFDHNGSLIIVNYDHNDIRYDTPSDRMGGLVRPGDPVFTGRIQRRGTIEGTAYVYKKGCSFIFYKTSGRYDPALPGYVMTGAAPVRARKGCDVIGYSIKSPNARLLYVDIAEKEKREQNDYARSIYETESDPDWMKGFKDPTGEP
jgi:hypothetical protein